MSTTYWKIRRKVSHGIRNITCYLPSIGLVQKPSFRENGISVYMRTKNDEWIDLSLRSIRNFSDEVIVADTSTDQTPKIIEKVASEENIKLKFIKIKEDEKTAMSSVETYVAQSNVALKNTRYKWVFRWEADFVARTSGSCNILNLRKQILSLDNKKYHWIEIPIINLDGDVFHIAQDPITVEAYACTFSPDLQFKKEPRMEILKAPKYYKVVRVNEFYIFHLRTVKSAKYLLFRRFWDDWKELAELFKQYNIYMPWSCQARATSIDRETLRLVKRMGCVNINVGFESGCQKSLDFLKCKTATIQDYERVLVLGKDEGVMIGGTFIFGSPDESLSCMKESLSWIEKQDELKGIGAGTLIPYPQTTVWDICMGKGLLPKHVDYEKLIPTSDPEKTYIINRAVPDSVYVRFMHDMGRVVWALSQVRANSTLKQLVTLFRHPSAWYVAGFHPLLMLKLFKKVLCG